MKWHGARVNISAFVTFSHYSSLSRVKILSTPVYPFSVLLSAGDYFGLMISSLGIFGVGRVSNKHWLEQNNFWRKCWTWGFAFKERKKPKIRWNLVRRKLDLQSTLIREFDLRFKLQTKCQISMHEAVVVPVHTSV